LARRQIGRGGWSWRRERALRARGEKSRRKPANGGGDKTIVHQRRQRQPGAGGIGAWRRWRISGGAGIGGIGSGGIGDAGVMAARGMASAKTRSGAAAGALAQHSYARQRAASSKNGSGGRRNGVSALMAWR